MQILRKTFPFLNSNIEGLLIIITAVIPLISTYYFQDNIDLFKLIFWAFGLGIVVWLVAKKKILYFPDNKFLKYVWITLIVSAILSTVFSWDWRNSLFGVHPRAHTSLYFVLAWCTFVWVYYQQSKSFVMTTMQWLVYAEIIVAVVGIFQFFGFAYYSGSIEDVRVLAPSLIGNPNFAGMYVATLLPMHFYLAGGAQKTYAKIFYYASLFVSLFSLVVFNSRAVYLSFVIGAIVYFALTWKHYSKKFWLLLTLFSALGYYFVNLFVQITRYNAETQDLLNAQVAVLSRIVVGQKRLTFSIENWLFGNGFANFFLYLGLLIMLI
ncbi:MAG: hypothetical protein R3B41_04005 [Candidatus Doudnabacteria bacterium]